MHDPQPQPSALGIFGGEEGLEDLLASFKRDTRPVVRYHHADAVLSGLLP